MGSWKVAAPIIGTPKFRAAGGNLALPFLEQAVRNVTLDGGDRPVVVADYGSSQGKNSLAPMSTALRALRARLGPDRPIFVFHIDQPANDFNTLFEVLHRDRDRYAAEDPNVFPSAIGRSFYERVLPPAHVDLGWSSYAAMWLSRVPTQITGHFRMDCGTDAEVAACRRQAAQDWESFLSLRARELRPGGRLVIVLAGLDDDGASGLQDLMDQANGVLADMVSEGTIRADERRQMVLGTYPRRKCELLAPFDRGGQFQGLTAECCASSRRSQIPTGPNMSATGTRKPWQANGPVFSARSSRPRSRARLATQGQVTASPSAWKTD